MAKLQKAIVIALILIIISVYTYAIILYSTMGKDMFLSDPKDITMSLWAQLNSLVWTYGFYILIGLFILSLAFRISKPEIIKMSVVCFLFLLLNYTDPFGIINWILD